MNAVEVVAERMAELNNDIENTQNRMNIYDEENIQYKILADKLDRLFVLKEQNETIYMMLRGFQ